MSPRYFEYTPVPYPKADDYFLASIRQRHPHLRWRVVQMIYNRHVPSGRQRSAGALSNRYRNLLGRAPAPDPSPSASHQSSTQVLDVPLDHGRNVESVDVAQNRPHVRS